MEEIEAILQMGGAVKQLVLLVGASFLFTWGLLLFTLVRMSRVEKYVMWLVGQRQIEKKMASMSKPSFDERIYTK